MVQSQPRACVVIEAKTFCETTPTTPSSIATALIGMPAAIIIWGIMGFVVAKIVSKAFQINDVDNPLLVFAGLLVPPMIVGVIVLLFS